jgi:mono/diheme cytochrome c family protein
MRKGTVVLLAIASACAPRLPASPTGERVLEVRGRIEKGPHVLGAGDLARLPRRSFRATDPATGRTATYEGADLAAIVDRTSRRPGVDTVIVRTRGGLAAPVPLWIAWQFRPVLADRADGAPLPALVLAWPNAEQLGLATDPRALAWWAHGVEALELVDWPAYSRAIAPPPGTDDAVRLGAGAFQERCVACHAARGVGGTLGPDLGQAASRLPADAFERAVRGHRAWPEARPEAAPSREEIARVRAFLAAVAAAPPDEEPPEPGEHGEPGRRDRRGGRDAD